MPRLGVFWILQETRSRAHALIPPELACLSLLFALFRIHSLFLIYFFYLLAYVSHIQAKQAELTLTLPLLSNPNPRFLSNQTRTIPLALGISPLGDPSLYVPWFKLFPSRSLRSSHRAHQRGEVEAAPMLLRVHCRTSLSEVSAHRA